jgi:CDP-diacylglycerol pyrophosphatase
VVGIAPCEDSITRLTGAVLLEANDDWALQHRTMPIEAMAELDAPHLEETSTPQITPAAA